MVFLPITTHKIWLTLSLVFAVVVTPSYAEESGTWKDPKTGLTWQRCSLGQAWNGYDCDGEPKAYTWDEAQRAANAVSKSWRIPAASELMSLVRCNTGFQKTSSVPDRKGSSKTMPTYCNEGASRPTIDTTIFPNTPDNYYWSSMPAAAYRGGAWIVHFYYGDVSDRYGFTGASSYVRLVRSSQ